MGERKGSLSVEGGRVPLPKGRLVMNRGRRGVESVLRKKGREQCGERGGYRCFFSRRRRKLPDRSSWREED